MSETTLPMIATKLQYNVFSLEEFKTKLPSVSTEDLVDGYVDVKDIAKRIDDVVQAVRVELLDDLHETRFFDPSVKPDEKGHRYLSGHNRELKAEKRIMKPKLNQEKAREFFEGKGLLHKVSDVQVSLSTDDIERLIVAAQKIGSNTSIWARVLRPNIEASAKVLLERVLESIHQKGVVTINEDKISALVALEEITVFEAELLFTYDQNYALKVVKEK